MSEFRLKILREDLAREETAVRLGWGDPAKVAQLDCELRALADKVQAESIEDWERLKAASARVFREPAPRIPKDSPLWVLSPMGIDDTLKAVERRMNERR